ncbi:MAG: hypothetical protein D6689_02375 [Deltaproteobacteria bacterium]|nr:MAG: hypothetical protein D6689_02375 [Deltaproteobacteria bacterium]
MTIDDYVFRIEDHSRGGRTVLAISGVIDEHADLRPISAVRGDVEISMKGVRRINSFGVRAWIDAIRKVPPDTRLRFVECPPPVVDQINMVQGFLGHGELVSFYSPMVCEECDEQADELFYVDQCRERGGKLPPVHCKRCGNPMEVDDLEEQYLLFIRETA